jgi:Skp family chaperone for outer membrane proteins
MARTLTGMLLGMGLIYLFCETSGRNAVAVTQETKTAELKPARIALIDMAKIFKNSRTFEKGRQSLLDGELGEAQETAKSMYNALLQMKKELDQTERGAEERAGLEAKMKVKAAEYEKFRVELQRNLAKAEAKIYVEVYESAASEVAAYAREHSIDLVIRFNADPLEKEDPAKVMSGMNRQVIYENGLDITDEIIAAMK